MPFPLSWLRSQTAFSRFEGAELAGWPIATFVRGRFVYAEHDKVNEPCTAPIDYTLG